MQPDNRSAEAPRAEAPPATPAAPGGTRRAVLIGIDAYQFVNPLGGCVNDALAIHDLLVSRGNFAPENVRVLLASRTPAQVPDALATAEAPTNQKMHEYLDALARASRADDEVVIYYAGHGVRIANPQNSQEQIGAIVPVDARANGTNFIINRDLNEYIQRAVGTGATVTVILDCCHSGGATRSLETEQAGETQSVRELEVNLTAEQWAQFQAAQGLGRADLAADTGSRDLNGSGWVPSIAEAVDLIVLSGCRDLEKSKEYPLDGSGPRHGAMTYFLLDAVQAVKAEQARSLRWEDIYPKVRNGVLAVYSDQMPTLEGRRERPFLGGNWQPYEPGFTVSVTPQTGALTLNGGEIHGLGEGAEVALYAPGTADFAAAEQAGGRLATAQVTSATPISSQARVVGAATIPDQARARLIKPSARTRPLGVLLTGVPEAVVAAARAVAGAATFLTLTPGPNGPDVEVRPWTGPGRPGWVIVPYSPADPAQKPPTPDEVIAYLPTLEVAGDAATLGGALGDGLVHWAKYRGVLTRRNEDLTLQGAVAVTLLTGTNAQAMRANPNNTTVAQPARPDAAGQYQVTADTLLLLKVRVAPTSPMRLFMGILLCSDDGNIDLLWPPASADNVLAPGEEKIVGLNGPNPFGLTVRDDQQASRYTFKVFASDEQHPIELTSLTLPSTVQEVINAWFERGRAVINTPPADVLWTTLEVPVRVRKQGG